MIIGIPKEIKNQESRVACIPSSVAELVKNGHKVLIEKDAGLQSGIRDEEYLKVGAEIIPTAKEVWEKAEMIYKVKEPIESEYQYLRENLIVYAYLHLAAERHLTDTLLAKKCTGIAFETVQIDNTLPLLTPMSEVAGRMGVQEGAKFLTKPCGGKGILLQGVPGVPPAYVVVIGAGVAGTAATRIAIGMGARVTVIDNNIKRLTDIGNIFDCKVETVYSNSYNIGKCVKQADLVISTVLIPGAKAPKIVTEDMIKSMEPGSVVVDIAIDQGGSIETTENHPTTHSAPVYVIHDVIHYSVANMPGAVAKTSTYALSNVTTKYALLIANYGWKKACKIAPELIPGVNTFDGKVTCKPVADVFSLEHLDVNSII